MPITGHGWELLVTRLGQQRDGPDERTYGRYQLYRDGGELGGVSGFMCECIGPGDNSQPSTPDRQRRIAEGVYGLLAQVGPGHRYVSVDYSDAATTPDVDHPLPCIGVQNCGARSAILVHPAHEDTLYLSSIGCLNPTGPLAADQKMAFDDSRGRVLALLEDLEDWSSDAFEHPGGGAVLGASLVIDGEPIDWLDC